MIKKDLKQIIISFLITLILVEGFYIYGARRMFTGFCKISDTSQVSCTFLQYLTEPVLVILELWFSFFLFVFLIVLLVRKLNTFGYYVPYLYHPNSKWYFTLIYPFIMGPIGLYRLFRAIKRWIMREKPTGYPDDNAT